MRLNRCFTFGLCVLAWALSTLWGNSQEATDGRVVGDPPALNLGGWTDLVLFRDWRIQRHALLGRHRLTDPNGRRHAVGSFDECMSALKQVKREHQLPPLPKHVVLVLHGHGATPALMQGLVDYLRQEGKFHVENIGYASTLDDIGSFAKALDGVVRHLEGVETIDFVAHSLGNIVIRRFLGDIQRLPIASRPTTKFHRFVMISPPNHGAEIVELVAELIGDQEGIRAAAEILAGEAAQQLAPNRGWPELEKTLAIPDFEFAVIAGGRGDSLGILSQLPGDDDGLLTLETTKLVGAADFAQVDGVHQLMARNGRVREMTVRFLKNGYLISEAQKKPIR
ncbi:MAG: hypothetical protein MUD03_03820 [Pirellula sp.]|nr:hypothetical protein [Pirellula sp.]